MPSNKSANSKHFKIKAKAVDCSIKFTEVFTIAVGLFVILYSLYALGRAAAGGTLSTLELQLWAMLMVINMVNLIHVSSK
jgi:hypothetical protein